MVQHHYFALFSPWPIGNTFQPVNMLRPFCVQSNTYINSRITYINIFKTKALLGLPHGKKAKDSSLGMYIGAIITAYQWLLKQKVLSHWDLNPGYGDLRLLPQQSSIITHCSIQSTDQSCVIMLHDIFQLCIPRCITTIFITIIAYIIL